MRARERDGLFDMVKNAASDGRPHPEERACESRSSNSNVRARVAKEEDEPLHAALMLRDASQRASAAAAPALASRCDAPQHEGEKARRNLWLSETMSGSVSLFPACSLQGAAQPQRVAPSVVQPDSGRTAR
jgi:hypothetical protein